MKYTVKKLEKGEKYYSLTVENGTLDFVARKIEWLVIDENEAPVITINDYTKKLQFDIFSTKRTARLQADYLNNLT